MKEFYNGGFAPEVSVSMLKETIALVRDYVSKTRKYKVKLAEKALSTGEPCTCGYVINIYIYMCVCMYVCINYIYFTDWWVNYYTLGLAIYNNETSNY